LYSFGGIIYFILSKQNPSIFKFDFTKNLERRNTSFCEKMIEIIQNLTLYLPEKRFSILNIVEMLNGDVKRIQFENSKNEVKVSLKSKIKTELMVEKDNIVLSTTTNKNVTELNPKEQKIDQALKAILNDQMFENVETYELLKDKEILLAALKMKKGIFQYAPEELQNDKEVVIEAVRKDAFTLEYASEECKNDIQIVKEAVKSHPRALLHASEELRNNKEFIFDLLHIDGVSLLYASEELKDDKEIALKSLEMDGTNLKYLSNKLKMTKVLC
jgi:hypothetical protein